MSEDNGFVERPAPRLHSYRAGSLAQKLRETAENGKALLIKVGSSGYSTHLKRAGYRLRRSTVGAPAGYAYAWTEKIEP